MAKAEVLSDDQQAFRTALNQATEELSQKGRVSAKTADELTFRVFQRAGVSGSGWEALHEALKRRYSGRNRDKTPN